MHCIDSNPMANVSQSTQNLVTVVDIYKHILYFTTYDIVLKFKQTILLKIKICLNCQKTKFTDLLLIREMPKTKYEYFNYQN